MCFKMSILWSLFVLCWQFATPQRQHRNSPCPDIFDYNPTSHERRWHGLISLQSDEELQGVFVTVVLDREAKLVSWFGDTATKNNREFTITDSAYVLAPGTNVTLKFYVIFDDDNATAPSLTAVRLNGRTICPQRKTPSATTTPQRTYDPSEIKCGRISATGAISSTPSYERNITEGEWPWHAAIYRVALGLLKYFCGGILISDRFVLTAARCVTLRDTEHPLSPDKFLLYFGTTSIRNFSTTLQIAQLSKVRVHPSYFHDYYRNNIALLKTTRSVLFTDYVRPICLWEGDGDLMKVVGSIGTVIGWGTDENVPSEILRRTEMPIVDHVQCIFSNRDFYSRYTSSNSFCAGFRNGSTGCRGDSGSGMFFRKADLDGSVSWYLRGLVSVTVPIREDISCDSYQFIVFTDVAKFIDWIPKVMNDD